jgi:hypothetical protein
MYVLIGSSLKMSIRYAYQRGETFYYQRKIPLDLVSRYGGVKLVVGYADLKEVLIEKGRERLNHFSWDKCANETLNVYRSLI